MSRKSLFVMLGIAMLFVASNALAAGFVIGAKGGMVKFTGDAGDDWKTGFMGGVTVDYLINDMWAAGANFDYRRTPHHDDGEDAAIVYPGLTGTISDKLTLMDFGAHAKFMFPMQGSPIHPYAVAGVGMYSGKEKFETDGYSEEFDLDSEVGFRGGAGAIWMANEQFGVGVEGNYHSVQTEGESTNLFDFGLVFTWKLPTAAK